MIAPIRCADSMLAATTSSSIVSSADSALREVAEERRAAEVRQRAPDVGLEQHDDREHDVADEVADQPVDGLELRASARGRTAPTSTPPPSAICTARVPRISFSTS